MNRRFPKIVQDRLGARRIRFFVEMLLKNSICRIRVAEEKAGTSNDFNTAWCEMVSEMKLLTDR